MPQLPNGAVTEQCMRARLGDFGSARGSRLALTRAHTQFRRTGSRSNRTGPPPVFNPAFQSAN